MYGVQDSVALNICREEICHAIKTAVKLPVPYRNILSGSGKLDGDKLPLVKQAKKRAKLWYDIWKESDKPRSGGIFQLFRSTKKDYLNLTEKLKSEEADKVSEQALKNHKDLWKFFKRFQISGKTCSSDIPEKEWLRSYSSVWFQDPKLKWDCDKCPNEKLELSFERITLLFQM